MSKRAKEVKKSEETVQAEDVKTEVEQSSSIPTTKERIVKLSIPEFKQITESLQVLNNARNVIGALMKATEEQYRISVQAIASQIALEKGLSRDMKLTHVDADNGMLTFATEQPKQT